MYAELGTTWFVLLSHPEDAAHVLGKLLLHLGEDNIIWGTDSIWYGPTQPVLDAFRAFQIPDAMCERLRLPEDHGGGEAQDPDGERGTRVRHRRRCARDRGRDRRPQLDERSRGRAGAARADPEPDAQSHGVEAAGRSCRSPSG